MLTSAWVSRALQSLSRRQRRRRQLRRQQGVFTGTVSTPLRPPPRRLTAVCDGRNYPKATAPVGCGVCQAAHGADGQPTSTRSGFTAVRCVGAWRLGSCAVARQPAARVAPASAGSPCARAGPGVVCSRPGASGLGPSASTPSSGRAVAHRCASHRDSTASRRRQGGMPRPWHLQRGR